MYADFYRLKALPFQLSPDPRFFFGSAGHRKAIAYLTYGLHQREGFIVITGDIGAGKTTLAGQLLTQLDAARHLAATVVSTQLDADDMLRMAAAAFGVPTDGADKASLLRRLEAFFTEVRNAGRCALLIVDEVQNLPVRALEELRMLSNFQAGGRALLQGCLLGQPQFRDTLARPELEQLRQRVLAAYHLGPLEPDETRAYIEHRLATVGWRDDPHFTDDAFALIHERTGGLPRRINACCSRLMLFGFLEELHRIDAAVVAQVAAELEEEMAAVTAPGGDPVPGSATEGGMSPGEAGARIPPDLERRIADLERLVLGQRRALRKALELASHFVERKRA